MSDPTPAFVPWLFAAGFAVAFSLAPVASAQSAPTVSDPPFALQTVPLRNGTALRGRVVQQQPGQYMVVETEDGWQMTIPWQQIGATGPQVPAAAAPVTPESPTEPSAEPTRRMSGTRKWGWGLLLTGYVLEVGAVMFVCEDSHGNCDKHGQRLKVLVPVVGPYWAYSSTTNFTSDEDTMAMRATVAMTAIQATGLALILFGGGKSSPKAKPAAAPPASAMDSMHFGFAGLPGGGFGGVVGSF